MHAFIFLTAALLLSGCSGLEVLRDAATGISEYFGGADNAEPPAELKEFEPSVKLRVIWDATIGKGYAEQFVNLVPAVSDDRVFAADRKGEVQARDRLKGDRLWSVDTELALSSGPVIGDDTLILGTSNAELLALNSNDGSLAWKTTLSSEVIALPRVENDLVVVRTSDGKLTGIDRKTGATRWYHERMVPALSIRSRGSPAIADDLVLDGYGGGKLSALGLNDGKPVWEATIAVPHGRSEVERLVEIDSDPIVRGDTAYVTGYQGGVAAVGLKDGEVLWRHGEFSSCAGMADSRRALFITDVNSDVWRLDPRNGADLWKQAELHQRRLTGPALVKDYLVVGDFEGYLHLLSQDDGSLVGRLKIDDEPIEAAPVVRDDVIYVYSDGGVLAAVAVE
jgi:outer membrane protein assembly factor BamB